MLFTQFYSTHPSIDQLFRFLTSIILTQIYSFPPNNTPVTKVYVFGKPVYIRQPFVKLQRYGLLENQLSTDDDANSILLRDIANPIPDRPRRLREHEESSTSPPNPFNSIIDTYPTAPSTIYPLKSCYTDSSGFLCCNPKLEQVMKQAIDDLAAKPDWNSCNVQKIANKLQERCEGAFNTQFEAVVGLGDFASKSNFYSDYICKIERHGRYLLAYGTPNRHNAPEPAKVSENKDPYV
ncbi:hypothetical protein WR25_14640 [Diploscapter pachys]|uniref:Ground-like domain-containing protein n=1 Tax=Diploscapter pachys TaxID=2018661 RepID=A0A2A2LJT9_9BILA|nr:hypothetical protein WR25_14640 [Diploscapter pachys]